jgi:DNA repair exonuclease SbcCD ATPase subunit
MYFRERRLIALVIDKLDIEGYGKLTDTRFSFAESFNVICGTNESGKTTMLRSVLAVLFGQESDDEESEFEEMRPWDSKKYTVSADIKFKNNTRISVARNFIANALRIIEIKNNGTRLEPNDPDYIRKTLGLSREEFISCAVITNEQISNPDEKELISSILTTIAISDEGNRDCREALAKLETAVKEASGGNSANKTQQSGSSSQHQGLTIEKLEDDKKKFTDRLTLFEGETKKLLFLIRREELNRTRSIITQLENIKKEIQTLKSRVTGIDANAVTVEGRANLYTLSAELNTARQKLEEMETLRKNMMDKYGEIREIIRTKEKFLDRGEEKLDILELALTYGESRGAVTESRQRMLGESKRKLTEIKASYQQEVKKYQGFSTPEEFDEKVSDLETRLGKKEIQKVKEEESERLRAEQHKYRIRIRQNFIASIFAIVAGGGLIFLGIFTDIFIGNFEVATRDPIRIGAGLGLIFVGFLMWFSTKSIRTEMAANSEIIAQKAIEIKKIKDEVASAQIGIKELFARVGALSVDELRKKFREFNRIVIDLETTVNLVKTLESESTAPTGESIESPDARKILMDLGLLRADEVLEKYHIQKFREEYEQAKKLVEKSETMKADYEQFLVQRKLLSDKVSKLEESINEILAMGDVESREEYDEQYKKAQEIEKIKTTLASLQDKKNYLLDGATPEEIIEKEERLSKALELYINSEPALASLSDKTEKLEVLRDRLEETRQAISSTQSRLTGIDLEMDRIKAETKYAEPQMRQPRLFKNAEISENHKKAIESARSEIEQICRQYGEQMLFPALEGFMADILKKITGRYEQVQIGNDMDILLKQANSDKLVKIGSLSRAAREQVYFALRIGIIRLMSMQKRFVPIIVDNPFLNFDEERRMKVFEILLEMSQRHQLILLISSRYQKQEFESILTERNRKFVLENINHLELMKSSA